MKNAKKRNDDFSKKMKTKIEIDTVSGQPIERRMKNNKQHNNHKLMEDRSNNKMLSNIDNSVKHWWINLTQKRDNEVIIPHKY